jgi:Domain of unknown function (DUF6265)
MAAALLAACVAQAHAHPCTMSELRWMAGSWSNTAQPARAQERWALAPDDVLMGSAWEFPSGKSGFAEIMTVRSDGGTVSMLLRHFDGGLSKAWEERDAPMVFTAASCERNAVVFDGQREHAGEHMTYRRAGDRLTILADFLHHGVPDHEEWHMARASD